MFQHVTKCTTHFLLCKRRQKLKKRQEYTGKVLQSLLMKQISDNLRRKGRSKCHMTISEGKEKSQSGMQLYRKGSEHACPRLCFSKNVDGEGRRAGCDRPQYQESVSLRTELPRSVPRHNGFKTSQSNVLSRVPSCYIAPRKCV